MCAGNSVCLAVNCSEGQPKFKIKKSVVHDEFGLEQDVGGVQEISG